MQPLSEKHKLLPNKNIIDCQACERNFKTINELKKHVANKWVFSGMASALKESAVTTVKLVLED